MKALITYIAQSLVDDSAAVEVEEFDEDGGSVFELTVAPEDLGKVIGKQGRTARAMRTLLAAAATKTRRRVSLEILE
jgi:predicted RNA-binding protein YlqC (UPF0109 family)